MTRDLGLAAAALALLGACQPGDGTGTPFGRMLGGGPDRADAAAAVPAAAGLEEIEVEAPDVYSLTAQGLWDGRPSLGGVWVAHPDVTAPQRVVIRGPGGSTVTGALFRRERDSAGPDFQISSEAATALGIPPGTTAELAVVALRREARAVAPVVEAGAAPEEVASPNAIAAAPGAVTAEPLDPAIGAAVAAATPAPSPAPTPPAPVIAPPAPGPADATVVAPGAIDAPYVQVGFFAEEGGATAAADRLRAAGIETRVALAETRSGRLWRVVAGPAETPAARDELIAAIRAEGYERPVPVAN